MEEINFWDVRNFENWQAFRDFWRDHYARAGKPIADDSESFWKAQYQNLKEGKYGNRN